MATVRTSALGLSRWETWKVLSRERGRTRPRSSLYLWLPVENGQDMGEWRWREVTGLWRVWYFEGEAIEFEADVQMRGVRNLDLPVKLSRCN